MTTHKAVSITLMLCAALTANAGFAQETYPARAVRIVTPFPAGSGPDAVSRLIGERLGKEWGQAVIVDPRPGGNGFIAMEAGKRAAAKIGRAHV